MYLCKDKVLVWKHEIYEVCSVKRQCNYAEMRGVLLETQDIYVKRCVVYKALEQQSFHKEIFKNSNSDQI